MRGISVRLLVSLTIALATTVPAAAEILGLGGKCLDLQNGHVSEGTAVILDACKENDNESQQWTPVDGKIVGPGSMCLDVGSETPNGRRAHLAKCSGSNEQLWKPTQGRITHPDGTCLEARGTAETENNPVFVMKCAEAEGQRWVLQ